MTAIQAMECELRKVQEAQTGCISESGYVLPEHRYRYALLVRKASALRDSIEWMRELYRTPVRV